jgi:hypothetical protein
MVTDQSNSHFAFHDNSRVSIQAWAKDATEATVSLPISSPPRGTTGTTVKLEIPLDGAIPIRAKANPGSKPQITSEDIIQSRQEPLRRDSLKRREALLKGKEGSRRRQRWENGSYSLTALD